MKQGFSIFELILVIVIVGILTTISLPRLERDGLVEATNQVVASINYTRHLAMQDSKFGTQNWFKKWWSLIFNETKDYCGNNQKSWKYAIYYDKSENGNLNSVDEVARDLSNNGKFFSAGWAGISKNNCMYVSNKFDLGKTFGIVDIEFSKECGNRSKSITFDDFGRPSIVVSTIKDGSRNAYDRILHQTCTITLKTNNKKSTISIEPMSGFLSVKYENF
jgi:carbamoyl-phosphate synthase large chain